MRNICNPFITSGYAGEAYFCDRVKDTEILTRYLQNDNNVVLTSRRRLGKSGLIEHCFSQPDIQSNYITIHVDIYATKNLSDFVYTLGQSVLRAVRSRGRQLWESFVSILSSLKASITFDINGQPEWGLGVGDVKMPMVTLQEIFQYLESAPKPCLIAIDEFQEIAKYPEANVEALLRTYVQRLRNCNFVFAGSKRHMLMEMFTSSARPFYMSSAPLSLDVLDRQVYYEFAERHFEQADKHLSQEAFHAIYDMFDGITWYVQFFLNTAFSLTGKGGVVTPESIDDITNAVLDTFDTTFKNILFLLPAKQKELYVAIGREGQCRNLTAKPFLQKYALTASSVQAALRVLVEKDLVTHDMGVYEPADRFFTLWLKR